MVNFLNHKNHEGWNLIDILPIELKPCYEVSKSLKNIAISLNKPSPDGNICNKACHKNSIQEAQPFFILSAKKKVRKEN